LSQLANYALRFLLILPAIVLHEVSHGYVAYLLGDPTAKRAGRLTLNPIKHIDPFGTLLLPAILILVSGAGFGYAKPVPVNPNYFKNYRVGFFITSIAGPTTNLLLAAISGVSVRFVGTSSLFGLLLLYFSSANLVLLFFNLIPIPPLDGSRVIPLFLTDSGMRTYARIEQYGFGILLLVVFVVPQIFRVDPLEIYFNLTVDPLLRLFVGF
jgi:Zn-dependent protease